MTHDKTEDSFREFEILYQIVRYGRFEGKERRLKESKKNVRLTPPPESPQLRSRP